MSIKVNISQPKDNFYLQWSYIYWWQFQFNLKCLLENELKGLGVRKE